MVFFNRFFKSYIQIVFLLWTLAGCSGPGEGKTPEQKLNASLEASKINAIYDILEKYPALESAFTYSNLKIVEFEHRLFGDFLGNDATADVLVALLDLFPSLVDTGTTAGVQTFSKEIQVEMKSKGPIPDLMSAIGNLTANFVAIEKKKILPFYIYLDDIDRKENISTESYEVTDYFIDILYKILQYLITMDDEDINFFMNILIKDLMEYKISEDGNIDFFDFDELIEKFFIEAPGGVSEILQGVKMAFYDEEIIYAFRDILFTIEEFLGDKMTNPITRSVVEGLYDHYDEYTLGGLIEAIWDDGPFIGPEVELMAIEGYGKKGTSGHALRELLMNADLMNRFLEQIYHFEKSGYQIEQLDSALTKMVHTDNNGFDLKGEGEFGNGNFYQPYDQFSFKNFSNLKGFIGLATRWSTPLTLTANAVYEFEDGIETKNIIRKLIPEADDIPIAFMLWSPIYEKAQDSDMGHGVPVTEKRGYGIMIDGEYVAPVCPAILTGASLCMYNMADSIVNGPYDNIFDNHNWFTSKRIYYLVIDLVQFFSKIPSLNNIAMPVFNMMGIKELPVIVFEGSGMTSVIYLEIRSLIENLPVAMSNAMIQKGIPGWLSIYILDQIKKYLVFGHPVSGYDRSYLFPLDIRDSWTGVLNLAFWDSKGFHTDRIFDYDHPEKYMWNYDIRSYTYDKNSDQANMLFPVVSALIVATYNAYNEVVGPLPLTLAGVPDRDEAARKAFSGSNYPFDLLLNIVAPLFERPNEAYTYAIPDSEIMPFIEIIEPLIGMESRGIVDSIMHFLTILGAPELKTARKNILEGISKVVGTIDESSESTYTLAKECLEIGKKAEDDLKRWDSLKHTLDIGHYLFSASSEYQVSDDIISLLNHLTSVDISDEEWARATEGMIEAFMKSANQRTFTRTAMHLTTILDTLNTKHIWSDTLRVVEEALKPSGVMNYVLTGVERDVSYTWEEIFLDANDFLHSELMIAYDEGTFWKDIYYLLQFLDEAFE